MNKVIITVGNNYIPFITEEYETRVDMTDLAEINMAVSECCGHYLEVHEDIYHASCPDLTWDDFIEGIFYMIEEVNDEF